MSNIISLEQWRREREQRRISPLLQQAARLRDTVRTLIMQAEILELQAYGAIDYDAIGDPRYESNDAS